MLLAVLVLAGTGTAELRVVPRDYSTIQLAVDLTAAGDTVLVLRGTYTESVDVPCRSIVIASEFLITGDSSDIAACIWRAHSGQRHVLATECAFEVSIDILGFTFSGELTGGGLEMIRNQVEVADCIFDSCVATNGAAIRAAKSNLQIERCTFSHCWAASNGAIAYLDSVRCNLVDCVVYGSGVGNPTRALFRFRHRSAYLNDLVIRNCVLPDERVLIDLSGTVDTVWACSCSIDSNTFAYGFVQSDGLCHVLTLERCNFSTNTIRRSILHDVVMEVGEVSVTESIFERNNAAPNFGGVSAMFVSGGRYADFRFWRNLFHENHWNDETCLNIDLVGAERVSRNYFIGNSSVSVVFVPCVTYVNGNAEGSFIHNVFQGNLMSSMEAHTSPPPARAIENFWGDASGPFNAEQNPAGLGDTVGTNIDFIPWSIDTLFLSANSSSGLPTAFAMGYPYPNPFNSSVTIEYALTREQVVLLEVFDVLGRKVETLLHTTQAPGVYAVLWNAEHQATGFYFARLSSSVTAQTSQSVKLLLLK
ncbi:T9SS type A sorting domain-containing protein [bacterium]|nr:T9SS type A sorting domain-containing protein [bacterium]